MQKDVNRFNDRKSFFDSGCRKERENIKSLFEKEKLKCGTDVKTIELINEMMRSFGY
jgi:hypothetical protein